MKLLSKHMLSSHNDTALGEIELNIEKLLSGGLGLAHHNGEAIMMPGALPGEKILAKINEEKRGHKRAVASQILKASPIRRQLDCSLAGHCGGCDFLHVEPTKALALKAEAALSRLANDFKIKIELIESPIHEYYRNRAIFHLGLDKTKQVRLGFFTKQREIVEISECRLLDPALMELLPLVKNWAKENANCLPGPGEEVEVSLIKDVLSNTKKAICFSPPPAKIQRRYQGGKEAITSLPSRCTIESKALRLRNAPSGRRPAFRDKSEKPSLGINFLQALDGLASSLEKHNLTESIIYARTHRSSDFIKISKGKAEKLSAAFWPEWNFNLKVKPGGFTQVNPPVNILMVKKIINEAEKLPKHSKILDLYAGMGNISIPLAKKGFFLTAIEESPLAAESAKENGKNLDNFKFICGDSEKTIEKLVKKAEQFKLLILDPPRSGAKNFAPLLSKLNPEMIIYVACHPAVLERDLPAFLSLGYNLEKLMAFDMFPRTSHIESLALLRRF